jgi:hypothetical protein
MTCLSRSPRVALTIAALRASSEQGPAGLPNTVGNHQGVFEDTVWLYVGEVGVVRP